MDRLGVAHECEGWKDRQNMHCYQQRALTTRDHNASLHLYGAKYIVTARRSPEFKQIGQVFSLPAKVYRETDAERRVAR